MKAELITNYIKSLSSSEDFIHLHKPVFGDGESKLVQQALSLNEVSTYGKFIDEFEKEFADYLGIKHVIATNNGTSALHVALQLTGARENTEVLTQSLTFVATANAISYCGAVPHFIDVSLNTYGLCPIKLNDYLSEAVEMVDGKCFNKNTKREIVACLPVHTLGFACEIDDIIAVCSKYNIPVVEDAAEAVGSQYKNKALGTRGLIGAFSFNGNKIITAGSGGAIATNDDELASRVRHFIGTGKKKHSYEYDHDVIGYNYRMANINAAILLAQLRQLPEFLMKKRSLYKKYDMFLQGIEAVSLIDAPQHNDANYWFITAKFEKYEDRLEFLEYSNKNGVETRAIWNPMHTLPMYSGAPRMSMDNTMWLAKRLVSLPSNIR